MYTEEDLNLAVEKGVFSTTAVDEFRDLLSTSRHSPSVDEENFKLIGGFNDIFVVIACFLLLFSSAWALNSIAESKSIGLLVFTVLSWLLSEFFVLKRKMALPAIALLLTFVGGAFSFSMSFFPFGKEVLLISAALISTIAACIHWVRFKVPITIAVGTAAAVGLAASLVLSIFPNTKDWVLGVLLLCGVLTFFLAMYWDSSDTKRVKRSSDIAFWLHLLAAPLIIHPIFSSLGVLTGNENLSTMAVVIILYILMTSISIVIDRRALMVSSLVYVIYALSSIIKAYGGVGYSFALTGVFIGASLLLLSAYWHTVRGSLVYKLSNRVKSIIPEVKSA
ncbi:MAG: hypothetical protein ACI9Y1_003411 [Lentisphaeria bacterium]|jgi:hypothetical protein